MPLISQNGYNPEFWSCNVDSVSNSRIDVAYVVAMTAIAALDYDDQTRVLAMLDARFGEVDR